MQAELAKDALVQPRSMLLYNRVEASQAKNARQPHTPTNSAVPNGNKSTTAVRRPPSESEHGTIFPYIPRKRQERSGLLIDYLYVPAPQHSGDQLDFLILGENRVGILLADVAGTLPDDGAPVLKTVLRSNSTGLSAAATLRYLQQNLGSKSDPDFTVTAFYAIFDQNKRLLNFASAGHLPMLIHRPTLGKTFLLNTQGYPFGRLGCNDSGDGEQEGMRIESEKAGLKQNDLLLLYSDGLFSAKGKSGDYFGRQRFLDFIVKNGELDPGSFLRELRALLDRFLGGKSAADDITVIAIKNVLRDLERPHSDSIHCDVAKRFLCTAEEQAILEVLRERPHLAAGEIREKLARTEYSHLTDTQIHEYLLQNGRWIQPWTPRREAPVAERNGVPPAVSAERQFQQGLLAAFPLRKIINKRHRFQGGHPVLQAALTHYNDGNYQAALDSLLKIRNTIKDSADKHCFFGNLYLLLEKYEQAHCEYIEAVNLDSRCTHALLALSYIAICGEDYHLAVESLVNAVRQDDDLPEIQDFLHKLIGAVEQKENQSGWIL